MFYTRPNIKPLNIDLVELSGGASHPSQFSGTTVDGSSIFIHYRYGCLSVYLSDDNAKPIWERNKIVEQDIGPVYHGTILLEQVCDLLGLTIFGIAPPFTEEDRVQAAEKDAVLDWSGRTTYWEEQVQTSSTGLSHFVAILQKSFPDLCILESKFQGRQRRYIQRETFEQCNLRGIIGIRPHPKRLASLLASDDVKLSDFKSTFAQTLGLFSDLKRNIRPTGTPTRQLAEARAKFTKMFGEHAVCADRGGGAISAEFATDDSQAAEHMSEVYGVFDACFSKRVALVDPQGNILRFADVSPYTVDLAVWCRQSADHYLSLWEEDFGSGKTMVGAKIL